ncbi:hypothetical protein RMATCC62417_11701 [Rhizopus microsporus]|nr:hypothetical protein RMATCC62417_11701 [Rhizopus microsporus]
MYRDGNSEIKLTEDNNLGIMSDIENLYRCDTDTDQECDQNIADNYDIYDNDAVNLGSTNLRCKLFFE